MNSVLEKVDAFLDWKDDHFPSRYVLMLEVKALRKQLFRIERTLSSRAALDRTHRDIAAALALELSERPGSGVKVGSCGSEGP